MANSFRAYSRSFTVATAVFVAMGAWKPSNLAAQEKQDSAVRVDSVVRVDTIARPARAMATRSELEALLAGKEGVPNFVEVPLLVFDEQQLDTWLKATPEGGVATPVYSQKWTVDLIDANAEGRDLPKVPLPGEATTRFPKSEPSRPGAGSGWNCNKSYTICQVNHNRLWSPSARTP